VRNLLLALALTLICASWANAAWTVAPASLAVTETYNQAPVSVSLTVTNTGTAGVAVTWVDSLDYFKGLLPSVTQTVPVGGTKTWTIGVNVQDPYGCVPSCPMPVGTYSGSVVMTGGGQTITVPVTLTVAPATPPVVPGKVAGVTLQIQTVPDPLLLSWTANTEPDLAGYKVYQRILSSSYGTPLAVLGKVTTYQVNGIQPGLTYSYTVTAYDTSGNESSKSNEVSKTIP